MAPKKSERLKQKSFKTKASDEPLVIHDESSESSDKETASASVSGSSKKNIPKKAVSPSGKKGKEKIVTAMTVKDKEPTSKPSSPKPLAIRTGRRKSEVCPSSFVDFTFFSSNGFYLEEMLESIGCKTLCSIQVLIFGECIKEFYENLDFSGGVLVSKVCNQKISISRADLIGCLHMQDVNDDIELLNLSKNELFAAVNGGLNMDYGREAMIIDFELFPRIIHKILIECICPRKGSTTSMSIEHAQIIHAMIHRKNLDMATRILDQIWKNRDSMVFGSALMKLFEFKGIELPSTSQEPLKLKKIGKEVLHHMSIYVKDCLWYANDGAHYIHERHRKRNIPFGLTGDMSEPVPEPFEEPRKKRKISDDEPSTSQEKAEILDIETLKTAVRDVLKTDINDLVQKSVQEQLSSLQSSQDKKVVELAKEIKGNSESLLKEFQNFRILSDEFSSQVKKDLNHNVIAFDRLVDQMRKVGDSVTAWFQSLDSKADKNTKAVQNLQGEIQMFLSQEFPGYVRKGAHVIDLTSSPEKQPSLPPKMTPRKSTRRS